MESTLSGSAARSCPGPTDTNIPSIHEAGCPISSYQGLPSLGELTWSSHTAPSLANIPYSPKPRVGVLEPLRRAAAFSSVCHIPSLTIAVGDKGPLAGRAPLTLIAPYGGAPTLGSITKSSQPAASGRVSRCHSSLQVTGSDRGSRVRSITAGPRGALINMQVIAAIYFLFRVRTSLRFPTDAHDV